MVAYLEQESIFLNEHQSIQGLEALDLFLYFCNGRMQNQHHKEQNRKYLQLQSDVHSSLFTISMATSVD